MPEEIVEKTERTVVKKSEKPSQKPNTLQKELKRVPWQRLTLSLIGIGMVASMWRWSVYHLYNLPEPAIVAFTSITNNAFYVIAAIVVFMVTGRLVYDWKNQTATTLIDQASHISEKRKEEKKEERDEHIVEEIHQIVEVREAGVNAPELKPFGCEATGDEEKGEHNDFER